MVFLKPFPSDVEVAAERDLLAGISILYGSSSRIRRGERDRVLGQAQYFKLQSRQLVP